MKMRLAIARVVLIFRHSAPPVRAMRRRREAGWEGYFLVEGGVF